MILNKKLIIKIFTIVLLVSILVAAILWFFGNKTDSVISETENNTTNVNTNNAGGLPNVSGNDINSADNSAAGKISAAESSKLGIESAAIFVAERFGSYSTDTDNFKNLRDAQFLMTEKMKREVDNMIDNYSKNSLTGDNYYGVTTKVVSVEILNQSNLSDGIAKILVSTQRVETRGKENPTVKTRYQKLEMVLVNRGKWLVESATWK